MYVREAYVLLEKVLEDYKARGIGHVVISGNPGLGKSWFAIYMLVGCDFHTTSLPMVCYFTASFKR